MYSGLDLESIAFETLCIADLFRLVADYGKEGRNGLDNYTDGIYLVSNMAMDNARRLGELTQHIINQE